MSASPDAENDLPRRMPASASYVFFASARCPCPSCANAVASVA